MNFNFIRLSSARMARGKSLFTPDTLAIAALLRVSVSVAYVYFRSQKYEPRKKKWSGSKKTLKWHKVRDVKAAQIIV